MAETRAVVSPSIYLVADHLDAVLAHGEDLLGLRAPTSAAAEDGKEGLQMRQRLEQQRGYLEEIRGIESRLIHRVLRAREHVEQVRRVDSRFKAITDLFIVGTHPVADAAAELGDSTTLDFNTGRDSTAYMRNRGLIDDTTIVGTPLPAQIMETFKLAGVIELGALLDLVAAYIDILELHYELYGEAEADPVRTTAALAPPVAH